MTYSRIHQDGNRERCFGFYPVSATQGGAAARTSSSNSAASPPVLLLLLATFLFSSSPAAARVSYDVCVDRCEAAFPNVVDSEKSCAATITDIHFDLGKVRDFLQEKHRCRGRFRKTCKAWKENAIASLERLSTLTLESSDCRELDAAAIRTEVALFDGIHSCRGDKIVTDIHDLLGHKASYLNQLNALGTRYKFGSERFGMGPDDGGRSPVCDYGQKPRRYYVWPLLQFYLALDSVGAWQSCMSKCRKPTPAQLHLWKVEERFYALKATLKELGTEVHRRRNDRRQRRRAEALPDHGCRPFSEAADAVAGLEGTAESAEQRLVALLGSEKPPTRPVTELASDVDAVAKGLEAIDLDAASEACRREDRKADRLEVRRREILESLALGEPFSLKAVDTFQRAGDRGAPCRWTGECSVPLICTEGACRGAITVQDLGGLLARADALRGRATAIEITDDKGLHPDGSRRVKEVEQEFARLEAEVGSLGWTDALAAWRKRFDEELDGRIRTLGLRIESALDGAVGRCEAAAADARTGCERRIEKIEDLQPLLEGVTQALEGADPVSGARWVRLKTRDLDAIEERLDDILEKRAVPVEESAHAGVDPAVAAVAGGLALLLAVAAVLLHRRRKRARGPRTNGEEG